MQTNPLISVIIPTFNSAQRLRKCLYALTKQTISQYEIIVCDDGSRDNTKEVVKKFKKVRYIQIPHSGSPGKVRNEGAKKAKGKILAFTDDDCYPSKDWLKNAVKYFKDKEVAPVRIFLNSGG